MYPSWESRVVGRMLTRVDNYGLPRPANRNVGTAVVASAPA
jgi:hypothetical protein